MSDSWKLVLPCTRAEAEAIDADMDALAALDPLPVLMTSEGRADDPDDWRLEAYFDAEPDAAAIAAIRALVPSSGKAAATPQRIPDTDWTTLSQAGLAPVRAGRFHVHTAVHAPSPDPAIRNFRIEASRAFGTGHHETTAGCLMMLDAMRRRGTRVGNLIDLGTGTGLLAFAALHLWPRAYATATDIDPVAIEMTAENAAINGVPLGLGMGRLALAVAEGTHDPLIDRRAPYDLIVANILAGPLIDLAADIAAIAAPKSQLILAGLLTSQASVVARAYRRQGYRLAEQRELGDWAILRLRLRA